MKTAHLQISKAIEELESNLFHTARVDEWAERMGYTCPKKFAQNFLRHYAVRPKKVLDYMRLESICKQLRARETSNFNIARQHGILDEIALNKFINYHLGCSPNELKAMKDGEVREKLDQILDGAVQRKVLQGMKKGLLPGCRNDSM